MDTQTLRHQINKLIKEHKIPIPITRKGFKQLCKLLNLHCTEITSFEALIHCRGPQMENSDPEQFDMEKLIDFVDYKQRIVPPADNPRQNVKTNRNAYHTSSQDDRMNRLPAIKGAAKAYLQQQIASANRSKIRSQQSYDSGDQRVTQAFRSRMVRASQNFSDEQSGHDEYHSSRGGGAGSAMKYMNMENMTAAQKKKMISHDPDFQYEMNNVMKQIDKSPRLRAKVFDQVGSIAEMWHE